MRASRSPGAVVRLPLHRACGRAGGAALFFCVLAPHRFNCRRCHFSRRAEIVRRRVLFDGVLQAADLAGGTNMSFWTI